MAAKSLKKRVQSEAYHVVFLQLLGVLIVAALTTLISGVLSGFSILLGGLAYALPNLIFVWRVFRYVGAHQMAQFATAFFVGEMTKMIVSALLVLLIVKHLPVSLLSVLIGLMAAIVSFWIACMWLFSRQVVNNEGAGRWLRRV